MLNSKPADQVSGGVAAMHAVKSKVGLPRARTSADQTSVETQTAAVGRRATNVGVKTRQPLSRAKNSGKTNAGVITTHELSSQIEHDAATLAVSQDQVLIAASSLDSNSSGQTNGVDQTDVAGNGKEATTLVVSPTGAVSPFADLCEEVVRLQKRRAYCIKRQQMADRSTEAYIANHFGYHSGLKETERKKLFERAAKIRKAGESGKEQELTDDQDKRILSLVRPIILASAASRKQFDGIRNDQEKGMSERARMLPGYDFIKGVRGVRELGFAIVIGEAGGGLDRYANKSKLWKRMGLAVMDGVRQGGLPKTATAEEWIKHGYSKRRRAEIWSVYSDSMFRAQWRGDKDEDGKNPVKTGKPVAVPAHPIGPYGEVYAYEKAKALSKEWTKCHAHNHARRVMTKEFLEDLWIAWRAAMMSMPQGRGAPAAVTLN